MTTVPIRHFHLFCGLGGGAAGFNRGSARIGNLRASFECIGGVDSDPVAIRNFDRLAGVPGTVLDLFDRDQYRTFHGRDPGPDWREAGPDDIRHAAGGQRPHIVFLSAPCKGFSGLLAEKHAGTAKYQALNALTVRGVHLMLEAWADDPPELVIFENVPRIATRGRQLVDLIAKLLRGYGYAVAETVHDCGELGGLAQSRRRFLLVARHAAKVPPYVYEPQKLPLRGVGEILEQLPLPGDIEAAGPMHRVPSLQWKTWVRLAFVEAGKDWRSLSRLRVGDDGNLLDWRIEPSWHNGVLGVNRWQEPAGTVAGCSRPGNGAFNVADPRFGDMMEYSQYGVGAWETPAATVIGVKAPGQGRYSIADPRIGSYGEHANKLRVVDANSPAGTVTGSDRVGSGALSVADPRPGYDDARKNVLRVTDWREPSGTVTAGHSPANGGGVVADPRHHGPAKHCNEFRVVAWDGATGAVSSAHGTGQCVADPRAAGDWGGNSKYAVVGIDQPAGTVIAASTTGQGAFAVSDPRPDAFRDGRDTHQTQGHYGVARWDLPTGAIPANARADAGRWSVADPRPLPGPDERLVCRITAADGTWHRPFTTLELAALQSLFDPGEMFTLEGRSDAVNREQIGNAVPRDAAAAIASVFGRTLLLAWSGETFVLSADPVWVRPVTVGLALRGAA